MFANERELSELDLLLLGVLCMMLTNNKQAISLMLITLNTAQTAFSVQTACPYLPLTVRFFDDLLHNL